MNPKMTAAERMSRLLAVIPWVVKQDGAPLEEIVTRFDYPKDQLLQDLNGVVFFVGVHPFTPDSLIEVDVTDEEVYIRYADWFSRPQRLTSAEGARLLTAGRSVLSDVFGSGEDDGEAAGPLLRALTKLGTALGEAAEQAVEVSLGQAPSDTLATLRSSLSQRHRVEIEYYTYGRDKLSTRTVEPMRIFSDHGYWYLQAWCLSAKDERVFRVDRIRAARCTTEPMHREPMEREPMHREPSDSGGSFALRGDGQKVLLRVHPNSAWVAEYCPIESHEINADGTLTIGMVVTSLSWFERLTLRLGTQAEIVAIDSPLSEAVVSRAAARVLQRYHQ